MAITKPLIEKLFQDMLINQPTAVKLKNFACDYASATATKNSQHAADKHAVQLMDESILKLISAQEMLWASKKYGVLVVLQGMDTAGKDGTIRHILSGVNPQGCRVEGFKVPTPAEHAHNFLWRYQKVVPERGEIVIFNRSYYEDVLVVKVHPEYLEQLPSELSVANNAKFWAERYEDINAFEKHLARNGIMVLKFFLHISPEEQKKRLFERLTDSAKYWKVSPADLSERKFWHEYTSAYQEALAASGQEYAPWLIIPANDKKIARALVAQAIAAAISALGLEYPQLSNAEIAQLQIAQQELSDEQ